MTALDSDCLPKFKGFTERFMLLHIKKHQLAKCSMPFIVKLAANVTNVSTKQHNSNSLHLLIFLQMNYGM